MSPPLCRCASVIHERNDCRFRPILAMRAELFGEMFDPGIRRVARKRVRLLNPAYLGDDPASRRFAQLEIDD